MSCVCQFCENKFTNKYSMASHQKTAKYCLVLQGKTITKYVCSICNKNLSDKRRLEIHQKRCEIPHDNKEQKKIIKKLRDEIAKKTEKEKQFEITIGKLEQQVQDYEKNIQNKETQISVLQGNMKEVAIKAATKSTSTIQHNYLTQNLTNEWLVEQAQHLSEEDVKNGMIGYAQMAAKHSLKDRAMCTDLSRKKLKYKDENGDIVSDPHGKKLTKKFFSSVKDRTCDIVNTIRDAMDDVRPSVDDDNDFQVQNEQMRKVINIESAVIALSQGKNHESRSEFISNLCSDLSK